MPEHPRPKSATAPSPAPTSAPPAPVRTDDPGPAPTMAPMPFPASATSMTPEMAADYAKHVWRPTEERAEPAKETPMDTPKCPQCEGRTQPYAGPNPHKQGSYECPKCQLRVRQG